MKVSLRRTMAIAAAYAVALHGLLTLSVVAGHAAGATSRSAFALCSGGGLRAGDHQRLPDGDHAHCLDLCLAAANTAGCDPDGRGGLIGGWSVGPALVVASVAGELHPAAASRGANRPRAPPA
jgi:hypothetical protein